MPDRFGFDNFGSRVRCVEEGCGEGGLMWKWPDTKREQHHARHEATRRKEAAKRQKDGLANARRIKAETARINEQAYGNRQEGDA